jgi:hypothetical protein
LLFGAQCSDCGLNEERGRGFLPRRIPFQAPLVSLQNGVQGFVPFFNPPFLHDLGQKNPLALVFVPVTGAVGLLGRNARQTNQLPLMEKSFLKGSRQRGTRASQFMM